MNRAVFGSAVQGASHIRKNTECQDSLKKVIVDDNTIILAVADGHGSESCPYSKTGSTVAVNVFCDIMKEYIETYQNEYETLLTLLKREGDVKIAMSIDACWKQRILKIHKDNKRETTYDDKGCKIKEPIYKLYGSTLLGMVITKSFLFAFQLGDGNIISVSDAGFENVIFGDRILGTETHSLSKEDSWKNVIINVKKLEEPLTLPIMYMLSTDGLANSYKNDDEFKKTCTDYFSLIKNYGAKIVENNLKTWLSETSELGCGDDVTALFAYYA